MKLSVDQRLQSIYAGILLFSAMGPALFAQSASKLSADVISLAAQPIMPNTTPGGELDEAREIARLVALPQTKIPIQGDTLAGAIRISAETAEMNFIAPSADDFSEPITSSTQINPWKFLQLLSDRYRFSMRYQGGVWLFSRESSGALIAKSYTLQHTNLDVIKSSSSRTTDLNASESSGGSTSSSAGTSGRMTGQGFNLVYQIDSKKVVDDIRQLIGLPSLASQTVIAKNGQLPETDDRRTANAAPRVKPEDTGQRVLYLPDTNTVYVVTFRSLHEHVAEYIRQIDQAPVQIRIEARFFATQNDPQKILGIDPTGLQPNISLSKLQTTVNLNKPRATRLPSASLLSSSDLSLQINALEKDNRTEQVQNPWVVTTNNQEALFSVGSEEPFLDSSTLSPGAVDGGLGSTTNRISVKRIGTAVNVIPTFFPGGSGEKPTIRLAVKLEIGRLTGFRQVTPQVSYPIVDSQKYEYTVYVREGQALAFGGLAGLSSSKTEARVPLLSRIPILGRAFKNTNTQDEQRKLIGYIIPTVVHDAPNEAPPLQLEDGTKVSLAP